MIEVPSPVCNESNVLAAHIYTGLHLEPPTRDVVSVFFSQIVLCPRMNLSVTSLDFFLVSFHKKWSNNLRKRHIHKLKASGHNSRLYQLNWWKNDELENKSMKTLSVSICIHCDLKLLRNRKNGIAILLTHARIRARNWLYHRPIFKVSNINIFI